MSERTGERLGFFLIAFLLVAALLMYLERCAEEGPMPMTTTPPPTLIPSPGVTTTPAPRRVYLPVVFSDRPVGDKGVGLSGPCDVVAQLNVDWYYNWGSTPCVPKDKRFVVMVWGEVRDVSLRYKIGIARATSGWLLGINEPDQEGQADMTPWEGAEFQRQVESQAGDVRLASPAPSQLGLGWLWDMVGAYEKRYGKKPRFDAIAVHYYAWSGNPEDLKNYLLRVRREAVARGYGESEIWLTEFAGLCTKPDPAGGHRRVMTELIPWMERQPWVGRYAWFASHLPDLPATPDQEHCSLMSPVTGGLSGLGEFYREF